MRRAGSNSQSFSTHCATGTRICRSGMAYISVALPKPVATWTAPASRKTTSAVAKRPSGLMRRGGMASIATPKAAIMTTPNTRPASTSENQWAPR